jgi:hypothetical protein
MFMDEDDSAPYETLVYVSSLAFIAISPGGFWVWR